MIRSRDVVARRSRSAPTGKRIRRAALPMGATVMVLVVALAMVGVGYGLWSKTLFIEGTVNTGRVNVAFTAAFTDDDDVVDDPAKDSQDTASCVAQGDIGSVPPGYESESCPPNAYSSCDPAATGVDPKDHYDKAVARCDARLATAAEDDDQEQPGIQTVFVAITNGYPSYHCTAWFDVVNNGTIPVLLHSFSIEDTVAVPCTQGATAYDLDGDGEDDVEICVSGLPADGSELQLDPFLEDPYQLDLDIHILQSATQNRTMTFGGELFLHQWNEEP